MKLSRLAFEGKELATVLAFAALYPVVQETLPDVEGRVPLYVEALLLPIAPLVGWAAVAGISVGSIIVDRYLVLGGLEDYGLSFTITKALTFLVVLGLARLLLEQQSQWWHRLAIVLVVALGLTLALGGYWAVHQQQLDPLWSAFLATLLPIVLWGYLILELLLGEKRLYQGA